LFGYRSVSQFAVELANRFVDDPCLDFVDHVAANFLRSRGPPFDLEKPNPAVPNRPALEGRAISLFRR
jgi:hypothetical protein